MKKALNISTAAFIQYNEQAIYENNKVKFIDPEETKAGMAEHKWAVSHVDMYVGTNFDHGYPTSYQLVSISTSDIKAMYEEITKLEAERFESEYVPFSTY